MKNSKIAPKSARGADPLEPRPLDRNKAVRGKYYARMQAGTNVCFLDPDLKNKFPDSESVNRALRTFLAMTANLHEEVS